MSRRTELRGTNKPTLSSVFVLPMCEINYRTLPDNFINCFIELNGQILVVFEVTTDINLQFNYFNNFAKLNKNFKEIIHNEDEIIFVFNIPERNLLNFNYFLMGKYSKFTEEYKTLLKSYYGQKSEKNTYKVTEFNVINPEQFKREQIAKRLNVDISLIDEVLDAPDLENEIYIPINKLIQTNNNQNITNYDEKQPNSIEDNNI